MPTLERPRRARGIRNDRTGALLLAKVSFAKNDKGLLRRKPGVKAYDLVVSKTQRELRGPGPTDLRLESLVESASTWSVELGIPSLAPVAATRARAILALISESDKNDKLRIFPSEHAGVSIQKRSSNETRVLEVNPNSITGEIHDRAHHSHTYYDLDSAPSAAAFLTAS